MKSFIDEFPNVLSPKTCNEIISRFERDTNLQMPGTMAAPDGKDIITKQKICDEIMVSVAPGWEDIDKIICGTISPIISELAKRYPGFSKLGIYKDYGYKLKKYKKGEGFYDYHLDGTAEKPPYLGLLWYLNTVDEGGETAFYEQGIKVKPEQGKVVTFPACWTHMHKGNMPISGDKFIIASWLGLK